jgi:hypothetical protein
MIDKKCHAFLVDCAPGFTLFFFPRTILSFFLFYFILSFFIPFFLFLPFYRTIGTRRRLIASDLSLEIESFSPPTDDDDANSLAFNRGETKAASRVAKKELYLLSGCFEQH